MDKAQETGDVSKRFSCDVLEFDGIVAILRGFISGPIGLPLLESLKPGVDVEEIRRELERASEAREFLRQTPRPSLGALKDPRPILGKLRIEGVSLQALEILALLEVARAAQDLSKMFVKSPFDRLRELTARAADFRGLIAELDGKILPDGSVDSSASPELARLRRSIERLRQQVQSSLEQILQRFGERGILQDAVVTIRNDRLVIPVRAEEKRRVPGVVHGASSSGATVYLEPLETVPLNNELVELQDQEQSEILRILARFTDQVRARREELATATGILSRLDLVFAKAAFARRYNCCLPEFASQRALLLRDLRHPLLEKSLEAQGRKPVPLTIELNPPKTLVVISGPNTGGKTVALKAIGIAVLMAQAALPVAASEARVPIFGRVLADIGDPQSIEANLSTFSGHILKIQSMLERAERNDLVLLDEIGASTEPHEGAALAIAILERFREIGAMTFVTTHHSRLKSFGAEIPEAANAAMEFDEETLQPTYRLLMGLPGKSSALDIASRLGLEPAILDKARTLLEPGEAEAASLIARLHAQQAALKRELDLLEQRRKELDARGAELAREFQEERRARLKELDARLEEMLRQFDNKWQSALAEFRSQAEMTKLARKVERKAASLKSEAREEWNAQVLEALGAETSSQQAQLDVLPSVGDRVQVHKFSSPGIVTAIADQDHVEVQIGPLRMRARKEEVRVLAPTREATPEPQAVARAVVDRPRDAPPEINVIGCTAEEAREQVDKFLDQAYIAGRLRLRIVHGHGKGVLKKALHEMLASHPHVEKFYPATQHEGGAGATIVELKM